MDLLEQKFDVLTKELTITGGGRCAASSIALSLGSLFPDPKGISPIQYACADCFWNASATLYVQKLRVIRLGREILRARAYAVLLKRQWHAVEAIAGRRPKTSGTDSDDEFMILMLVFFCVM